jgi:N6-L-threonylcarbamoyladenine synthase
MRILGIETSCDETAVCLLEASGPFGADFRYTVLGNTLLSQAALHAQYGGVFPNLAKREHAKNLVPLLHKTLENAGELKPNTQAAAGAALVPLKDLLGREPGLFALIIPFLLKYQKPDIDAIAVTTGPGLEPALWVGINFAKALSSVWDMPLVAVNHMEGHIIMSLVEKNGLKTFQFPALALLISGGHTELVLSRKFGMYELIGETRDDAAGEAFDKVARLLELGYPGGPEISRLAAEARETDIKGDFSFTRPMLHDKSFDFSFSGLKTAVRNVVTTRPMTHELKLQVAREFEDCVADVLVAKTLRAVEEYGAQTVVVGGGVSANTYIRQRLAEALSKTDALSELLTPPPELATDNALMIALAGYFHALAGEFPDARGVVAKGNLKLDNS